MYGGQQEAAVAQVEPDGLGSMSLADLLATAQALTAEMSSRLMKPGLLDDLPRLPQKPEPNHADEWGLYADSDFEDQVSLEQAYDETPVNPLPPQGTLPEIQLGVETLARTVDAARTALAGHTAELFDRHTQRADLLGIPEGKSAFRDAPDYLRQYLRIPRREARNRIERADQVMATRTLDRTEELPPRLPQLAQALHEAAVDPSAADLISGTLTAARREGSLADVPPETVDGLVETGERILVSQARDVNPGTLSKVCNHWLQRFQAIINPDGAEPHEAQLHAAPGLVYRGKGTGLHQWTIKATDAQHEILKTLVSAASNPRSTPAGPRADSTPPASADAGTTWTRQTEESDALDTRTTSQKELDGLVSALTGALALASMQDLPTGAGSRPQVMVTIDYQTLLDHAVDPQTGRLFTAAASYQETISPTTIRTWACDADIIPVVLGGEGQVLDVGRSRRLFTRRLRQAIAARDGGCAAPGCHIPAPWCEAHHIDHWEHGGPTSVDNGVLLCSHHHHAVHAGAWQISVRSGVPWFIPARYLDPSQRPRRNKQWRPGDLAA